MSQQQVDRFVTWVKIFNLKGRNIKGTVSKLAEISSAAKLSQKRCGKISSDVLTAKLAKQINGSLLVTRKLVAKALDNLADQETKRKHVVKKIQNMKKAEYKKLRKGKDRFDLLALEDGLA